MAWPPETGIKQMCSARLTQMLGVVVGCAAGGAGAVAWLGRRHRSAMQPIEPPSPTFKEWVAAIVSSEDSVSSA